MAGSLVRPPGQRYGFDRSRNLGLTLSRRAGILWASLLMAGKLTEATAAPSCEDSHDRGVFLRLA
jgi:hypothetical protein